MSGGGRPKSAFLAYCALAARLHSGAGITQAITPFLAEVCRQFPGEVFDALKFSNAVRTCFGFPVPRLAALGLAEQLADEGLLVEVSGHASKAVYKYAEARQPGEALAPPLTEGEVERVLGKFSQFCRADERARGLSDTELHDAFLDRLLHVDAMRLLTRREGLTGTKKTAKTLMLSKSEGEAPESEGVELHLDYLVAQFLLDLRDTDAGGFEQVSNVAFANMAAEAIACFTDPGPTASLEGLTVYLDSPLLLDILGVNAEYADYGAELLAAIKAGGAKAAVFDHSVNEAENTVSAQLAFYRSGVNKWGTTAGTNVKPDLLTALTGNISARAEGIFGIHVHRDTEVSLHRRAQSTVGDIQIAMNEQMGAWRKEDAREHDQNSIWQMLALRNATQPCPRVCECQWLFLTRNTALVNIANKAWNSWLKGAKNHSTSQIERWAPVAMSDKQFAGYLWTRSGGGLGASIPRARLLAHCSAAVRPRADVKAKAYNLVLEYEGQLQAEYFAALLEDREAAKALMRATRGDPEDVSAERLPYIMDVMRRAAGEYAADKVREEAQAQLDTLTLSYEQRLAQATKEAAENATRQARAQYDVDLQVKESERRALAAAVRQHEEAERARKSQAIANSFTVGKRVFMLLRWGFVFLLGGVAFAASLLGGESPLTAAVITAVATVLGGWFVPEGFNRPMSCVAQKVMFRELATRAPEVSLPPMAIDFRGNRLPPPYDLARADVDQAAA